MDGEDEAVEEAAANLAEVFASMGTEVRREGGERGREGGAETSTHTYLLAFAQFNQQFKRSLDDPEKMENARKNFLENEVRPSSAEKKHEGRRRRRSRKEIRAF